MRLKSHLKEGLAYIRMYLLANFNDIVQFFYENFWQPKPNTLAQVIDEFSKNNKHVFCIQVGSNDGFQHDPLCKFIKRDQWSGLLMEPQLSAFRKLSYIYKNDQVIPINRAVDRIDQKRKLYRIAFTDARWATGLSSFNEMQLRNMIASGHVGRQCTKNGVKMPVNEEDWIAYDVVKCSSFESLFMEFKVPKVDLLHIDTEGYDYEILKLYPFEIFQPQLVIFEHSHLSPDDYIAARAYLKKLGYQTKSYGADTVGVL